MLEVAGVDRIKTAEHHRMDFLKTGQWLSRGVAQIGDGVADLDVRGALDVRDEITDIAGLEPFLRQHFRREDSDFLYLVARVVVDQLDVLVRLDLAGKDADVGNDAPVDVEDAIEHEPAQNFISRLRRWRD